jgi:SAM-dependent methyltransferase
MLRDTLEHFYWWSQDRIVPGLRSSQYAYAEVLTASLDRDVAWLDLGCGRRPLPNWMPQSLEDGLRARIGRAVGVDADHQSLLDQRVLRDRVEAMADALPFASGSFDLVSANMVVEHLEHPSRVLGEIRRVLKPGGIFLFHTPNRRHWAVRVASVTPERLKLALVRVLDGRTSEDVFPTWYRFNDAREIRALAGAHGFSIERLDEISSSAICAVLGPVSWIELAAIRLMQRPAYSHWRSNLVGALRASESGGFQ